MFSGRQEPNFKYFVELRTVNVLVRIYALKFQTRKLAKV
jgi:hypothetical protein